MTITEFLLARIAEDEAEARAAFSGQADPENGWGIVTYEGASGFTISPHVGHAHERVQAEHIEKWDPARVLAECAAKRTIIDQAFVMAAQIDGEWGCCHSAKSIRADEPLPDYCYGPETAAQFLSPLAAVYADHPDYDTAWSV